MIKIYTTPTCPYCKLAKEFLREKNVSFDEINVAEDTEAAKEMVRISDNRIWSPDREPAGKSTGNGLFPCG
jgi:glutaredoxin